MARICLGSFQDRDDETAAGTEPDGPTELSRRSWWMVLKRTVRQFTQDNLADSAAALTYYAVLSLFPVIIVLASLLGLLARPFGDTNVD